MSIANSYNSPAEAKKSVGVFLFLLGPGMTIANLAMILTADWGHVFDL